MASVVFPGRRASAMLAPFALLEREAFRVDEQRGIEVTLVDAGRAFEDFFRAESGRLYGVLCIVTRSRDEADEIGQEAFARVWERWDRVSALEDPAGYLHVVAMNVFRSRYRRAKVAARHLLEARTASEMPPSLDERDELEALLSELTPRERAAMVLTAMFGFSSDEAGQILGIRGSTVRVLTTRARATLRDRREEVE
jgi:RNA polymerase sigma-70 factor (ECF subfamily)